MDQAINVVVALCPGESADRGIDSTYFERLLVAKRPLDSFNTNPRIAMVQALQVHVSSGIVLPYSQLHESIIEWLKKEKLRQDVEALVSAEAKASGITTMHVVQRWMTKKGNVQRDANLHQKRSQSKVDFERTVERKDQPLKTKCDAMSTARSTLTRNPCLERTVRSPICTSQGRPKLAQLGAVNSRRMV